MKYNLPNCLKGNPALHVHITQDIFSKASIQGYSPVFILILESFRSKPLRSLITYGTDGLPYSVVHQMEDPKQKQPLLQYDWFLKRASSRFVHFQAFCCSLAAPARRKNIAYYTSRLYNSSYAIMHNWNIETCGK